MKEEWKQINGFSNYEISSLGNIRKRANRFILKPSDNGNGYLRICLYDDFGERKHQYIHRLVLKTFKGEAPQTNMVTNHIDENKQNNNINNLEWITLVDNFQYGTSLERNAKSRNKPVLLVEKNKIYNNAQEAAKDNDLIKNHITAVCNGRLVTHGGFHWKYVNKKDSYKYQEKNNECKKKIRCVDTAEIFDSITNAAKQYGLNRKNINSCCLGKRHSCGGYRWEYMEGYNENI